MNFYQRLRDLREDAELNQSEMAKLLGTSQQQLSRWEVGEQEPKITWYIKYAEYFNVSIDYLAGLIDTPEQLDRFLKKR